MAVWPPFTRDDLKVAADRAEFDSIFPLLIRRLITETAAGLSEIDMPGGSGTASGGFDGVAVATVSTAFVPAGTSVWELSVEKAAKAKADGDYVKRTQGPNGESCADVTYVQVILRPWTKAREWRNARNQEGRWKEVKAYNLDSVHIWLESAPATTVWLAKRLGMAIPGVVAADDWWSELWIPATRIPLSAEIVLAGRDVAAEELVNSLTDGRVVTVGGGLRADDLRAVISASLQLATDGQTESVRTRTLFVDSIESMAQLVEQTHRLTLVVPDASWLSRVAVPAPHTVIVAAPPGQSGSLEIPAIDGEAVAQQLVSTGTPEERAHSWGKLARRSLLALRRVLAVNPVQLTPDWARTPDTAQRRLLLLGGWEDTNTDDRALVAQTVGLPYEAVQDITTKLAEAPDVPFDGRFRAQWHVLAPEDAWTLLKAHLVRDDLTALRTAAVEAFGNGHGTKFSATLRTGLAQSLALLGVMGRDVRLPGGSTGRDFCRVLISEMLSQANADLSYSHWTSLGDVLPLLAEAAPDELLEALRQGLKGDQPLHRHMFQDAEPDEFGFTPSSLHNQVLWALQTIAWSEDYFLDVVDLLARMAVIDPGGRWATRPDSTLVEMLSCWHPSTAADEQARRTGLRHLMRVHAAVARRLLLDLIPTGHELQIPAAKPQFRDWVRPIPITTRVEVHSSVGFVVELLLTDLGDDADRYVALLTKFEALSPQDRHAFVDKLAVLGDAITDDASRARLAEAVRAKVAHHREYADAQWALPEGELLTLEHAGQVLAPSSVVWRERWLFDSDFVELGDVAMRDDFAAHDAAVSARRAEAVAAILDAGGTPALADLVDGVAQPHFVGYALAGHANGYDQLAITWLREGSARQQAARGYLRGCMRSDGAAACDRLLDLAEDPEIKAEVLLASSNPQDVWERLSGLGEAVTWNYWRGFIYLGLGADFSGVEHVARNLLSVGRAAAAIDVIALYSRRVTSLAVAKVAAEACEAILALEEPDPELMRLREYSFKNVLHLLALHKESLGLSRVAFLEWQLFPALGFRAQAPILHGAIQEGPAFFADLVSQVFRPRHDDPPIEEDDPGAAERRRVLAERAYEVLRSWKQSPGIGADGQVHAELLWPWVTRAREALQESDRMVVGDQMIGQALSYAPPDTDGLFPPRVVRDLLEELDAGHVERGLEIGIVNQRGMTSRGLTDGGSQEAALAANYKQDALAASEWPRTKRILSRIAEHYEHEARREDDEAERLRLGLPD